MSDIKRWTWPTDEAPGNWVLWTDHVAAVAEAERRAKATPRIRTGPRMSWPSVSYDKGVADERERIRKAVEGLPKAMSLNGIQDIALWKDEVLAAIDEETP